MLQFTPGKTIETVLNVFHIEWPQQRETAVSTPKAIRTAYQAFQEACPEWVDSLFDASFLEKEAATLFANNRLPTAEALATAWRSQFHVGTPEQKAADIQKMVPAAATFLQMVKQELKR